MSDNWIVANLENAFATWNDKMAEIWTLVTTSPQSFKGGTVWSVVEGINGGLQAIGYGLLVLFFAMSVFKSTASFRDFQRPEYALKHFIRFVAAKVVITYAMDLMVAIYSICGGVVTQIVCFYTGIRIGELCALDLNRDIDLKRGVISIQHTLYRVKSENGNKKTELKISTPKSESSIRDIPLPKFLIEKLSKIENGSGFLIQKNGKFIEPNVYARRYKKILAELDIPYRKFHATRHTFATRALEIGMDIKTLSEILGHSSPTITLNLYSHSLPEHKKKEMDRLGKLYNPSN